MTQRITRGMRIFFEMNDDKDTLQQKLWTTAMLRGNFITLKAYVKKERLQINNLSP